ncbi:hypothetical protein CsSME_00039686 [Camellia sinensis var. sinensis]
MGLIKAAIGDAVLTFMWVFCASTLGAVTSIIASASGVQGMATLFITTVLVFILLLVFGIIGDALGGASFNPTGTAAFYAAGASSDSLFSMALRFPAQVGFFSLLYYSLFLLPFLCLFVQPENISFNCGWGFLVFFILPSFCAYPIYSYLVSLAMLS